MAANVIGSVVIGFAGVVLGTAVGPRAGRSRNRRTLRPMRGRETRSRRRPLAGVGMRGCVRSFRGLTPRSESPRIAVPAKGTGHDPAPATLLRLFANANETSLGAPVYRSVVEKARLLKLAGASVFSVELGYGAHRLVHDAASEYSSFEIPIVVEVVDATEAVMRLAGELGSIVTEGLVVLSPVQVVRYSHAVRIRGARRPESEAIPPPISARVSASEGASPMKIEGQAKRLTVYLGSADHWGGRNLAVAIVEKCRELGLAGATVSRGIMGFGKHSVIHKAHLLGLSDDLPEKIEIVDRPEQIEHLLPALDPMLGGGLIVIEDVQVIRYLHDPRCRKPTGGMIVG